MRRFGGEVPVTGPIVGILYVALVTAVFSVAGIAIAAIIAWAF